MVGLIQRLCLRQEVAYIFHMIVLNSHLLPHNEMCNQLQKALLLPFV